MSRTTQAKAAIKPEVVEVVDFDADTIEAEDEVTFTFRLGGRVWSCRSQQDVPMHLMEQMGTAEDDPKQGVLAVGAFFRAVLVEDQVDDFCELIEQRNSPLTLKKVQPIMDKASAAIFGRPTERSTGSSGGPRRTAGTSRAASSSRGTRRARSA